MAATSEPWNHDATFGKDDGGPAFPVGSGDMRDPTGLTIRDYFAAKAMAALISRTDIDGPDTPYGMFSLATSSYRIADAMITASKHGSQERGV